MADELVFTLSIKDNASSQIDAFTRKINGIGQQAQKEFGAFRENFNKAFGDLGKPINDINGLKTALAGLAGTGAAAAVKELGKFTVESIKNFAAYESALVSVQRTMGLSKTELDKLGESLRTLALTDLKGQVLADDLAQIAEVAGSLGVAKDDLIDFTKNVAMVATATDQSMEKVATSFGKIANVFKGSLGDDAYKQIGAIGSAFDKLADDMAATVPGMLNFTNRMGGVASSMGLTVDQTAALAATLESVGLPAERGATAMNNVMLTLMKNSKSFADALSIDAEKLSTALKDKPVEALQMVLKAMEELGQTKGQDELLRVMEDLMGKGNGVTEVVLKMQGAQKDLSTALTSSKKAFDDATRAGESFNQAAATQEASWKSISTAIDDVSKSLGQQLKPATEGASQGLAILATDIANTFRADNINQFFDDVISGFSDLKSANLTEWLTALLPAATQTITDLRAIVTNGITDILGGLSEMIGAGDWFAGLVTNAKQAFAEIKTVITDVFSGGMGEEEYAKEMEGIFSAQEIGLQAVTAATQEKTVATQADLDALVQLKTENLDLLRTNQDLRTEYQAVASELGAAITSGLTPTQDLIDRQEALRQKIADVGNEAYGNSTFPDMTAAMQASEAQTQILTAEMQAMEGQIKTIGKEYEETNAQIKDKQKTVRDLNSELRDLHAKERNASKEEKDGIQAAIVAIQNKRGVIQNEISDLQNLASDQKEARQEEIDGLKESIEAQKEKIRAVDELRDNQQRTADLRKEQIQEEMKAANDLYREQQKQAADSLKWLDQIDDATKKRVMGEEDAVKVLKAQGVTLTTLQEQELRRMQGAYKTEAAYEAQAKALAAQLSPMSAIMAAGDKLSNSLGGLSSGIGKIGSLFNIDTSGISNALGKVQEFAQLPQMFDEIKNSFSGIKDAFSQLKGLDLKNIFSGGGGLSGVLSSLSGIGSVAGIIMAAWGPLKNFFKGLFADTKSAGTEAAESFQKFVTTNISGGAEMAGAMKESFDQMTAANFDYQTFLQQTGSTMSQVMGGLSQNWQQGTTAMDMFTQAVVKSGVEVSKAPQVALQMTAAMDSMGLSTAQAAEKMVEVAEKAGMSTEEIEKLKAALAAGGKEGESTTEVFDAATQAAETLAGTTQSLTSDVSGLTAQLSGAGAEGGDTAAIFRTATNAAQNLSGTTSGLSGQVSGLANQLANTGGETLDVSNLFRVAGGAATDLSGNMQGLSGSAQSAGVDIDTLQAMLNALPAEKRIDIIMNTVGTVPQMAAGGIVQSGLAIVNERGSEIAKFPGGSMALMTARGATLSAFPVGTEIIPHNKSMSIMRENPYIPRMATGGTITAGTPMVNNYYQYTIHLNASVIDRNTARMIDAELQKLSKQRAGV